MYIWHEHKRNLPITPKIHFFKDRTEFDINTNVGSNFIHGTTLIVEKPERPKISNTVF